MEETSNSFYVVMAIRPHTLDQMIRATGCLKSSLGGLDCGIDIHAEGQYITVIWPIAEQGFSVFEHAEQVVKALRAADLPAVLPVSVSSKAVHVLCLQQAFDEARAALDAHVLQGNGEDIIQFEPRHFPQVLMLVKKGYLAEFSAQRLRGLLDYDDQHEGRLLHTLETYFRFDRSLERTAESLYVHPKTVKYRLDRIASLLKLEWTTDDIVEMYVALQIRKLTSSTELPRLSGDC